MVQPYSFAQLRNGAKEVDNIVWIFQKEKYGTEP
jgi:hypothetical protein